MNRLVELLGGECVHIPKRPGEPDCTWADITQDHDASWAGSRRSASRKASAEIVAKIDYWRDAPLWDPESIAKATKTWFDYRSPRARWKRMDAASTQLHRHKIKTAEEVLPGHRARGRARRR